MNRLLILCFAIISRLLQNVGLKCHLLFSLLFILLLLLHDQHVFLCLFRGHEFDSNRVQRVVHHKCSFVEHYEVRLGPSVHLGLNFDESARQ